MDNKFQLIMSSGRATEMIKFSQICQTQEQVFNSTFYEREWLRNHGKEHFIHFSDSTLEELRKYFNSLDRRKCGSIGVEDLEDPFIAFGLCDNRVDVSELIKSVDLDGSGTIQFNQFLQIMLKIKRGQSKTGKNSAIFDFFQKMSKGKLGDQYDQDVSFSLNVSQFRRKKILQSIMAKSKEKKDHGARIAQNFKKQIMNNPRLRANLSSNKKNLHHVDTLEYKKKSKK